MKIAYKGFIIKYSVFLNSCTFTTKENEESRIQNARLVYKAKTIEEAKQIIDKIEGAEHDNT